ncbi:LarC family nickel insertion protein [Fredinandcohnia sp. 179-A 10B2 NHS]|uniref:LarC family nickel insertion protein n=1 Tax=Fredinandcohnia sp. 179-A 10B2 NHS TaxID=3235176 RepID=UPI0039A2BA56
MIETSELSSDVKETSLKIFRKIGEAEGLIHGLPLEDVHFHEVGAVDSIIDIVGAAILINELGITTIKSSAIPVGTGKIHIDHGIYPVPAPATLEILRGVPIEHSEVRFELTTPTGAGIVAVLAEDFCSIPSMKVSSIGYGAGTKTFKDCPNVLRVVIGE